MPYQPKKSSGSHKSKGHHGFKGFLENLINDAGDQAMSFGPGLVQIGKAIGHDTANVVTGSRHPYQLDDYGKAIVHSYIDPHTYGGEYGRSIVSLLHGDLHGAKNHYADAWKAIYDHPVAPLMDLASAFTGGAAVAGKIGEVAARGAEAGSLASRAGARVAGLGADLKPLTHRVELSSGAGFDRKLARNPVVRGRQLAFEKLSSKVPEDAYGIGSASRVARHQGRTLSHEAIRENANTLRPMREALTGLHGLKRKAVAIVAGGHSIADYEALYEKRVNDVSAEIERKRGGGEHKHGTDLVLRENGKVERAGMDEQITHDTDGDHKQGIHDLLTADQRDSLKQNRRNLAHLTKRLGEVRAIREKGILDKPDAKLQKAVDEAHKLSAITTKRIFDDPNASVEVRAANLEKAANRATIESQIMRTAGVTDKVYRGATRSHVNLLKDMDLGGGRSRQSFTKGGKLAEAQRNTGYNFWNGRDSLDPSMYIHSARQVFEHGARLKRFNTILGSAHWVSPSDAHLAGDKYRVVEADSALSKNIKQVQALLTDAEGVLAGSPLYEQFKNAIDNSLMRPDGSTDLVPVVPKRYYDELVGEFDKSGAFVRRMIDNPTKVWRALTLNLRPAWIVNNYVGQMMMLAVAHGARGLGAYIEQFGLKGRLARELAPELGDLGWSNDVRTQLSDLPIHGKVGHGARAFSDFMGNLNQKLTDDPQRSAAWIAEMRPHVKKLMKEKPEFDTWEKAARELWKDPEFADEVTSRVLSDMVDFNDLSNFERKAIKRAIPFYAWTKGITKRTARLIGDEPWKISAGLQASTIGAKSNQDQFGSLPGFLSDITPLHGGLILKTAALNPFVTPSDTLGMIGGAFLPGHNRGPQNPLSQINPVFKVPIEAFSGTDTFTGADLDKTGQKSLAKLFEERALGSLAQKRLWDEWQRDRAAKRGQLDYDPIYAPSIQNAGMAYAGLPIRKLNRDAALARALEDSNG